MHLPSYASQLQRSSIECVDKHSAAITRRLLANMETSITHERFEATANAILHGREAFAPFAVLTVQDIDVLLHD